MATTAGVAVRGASLPTAAGFRPPLTERVLARLPGPRLAWLVGWGLLPFAAYELAYAAQPWPSYLGTTSNLMFGLTNLLGLWGVARLAGRVDQLQPTLSRLDPPDRPDHRPLPFRHVGNIWGPLAISAAITLTWDLFDFVMYPSVATALLVGVIFFAQLGITTFLWTYGGVLFGLDRLGRGPLRLEPFETDPHLGLKNIGSLAFEAFLVAGAMVIPIVIASAGDVRAIAGALIVVIVVGALFFISATSLHNTLASAKAAHVRRARGLVGVALEPVSALAEPIDSAAARRALDAAATRLAAAVEVERRALAIQDWPFDAAILRTVVAILTSATAAIAARLLLTQFGI